MVAQGCNGAHPGPTGTLDPTSKDIIREKGERFDKDQRGRIRKESL